MSEDVFVRRAGASEVATCVEPLSRERAVAFWRKVVEGVARGERVLLVAEDGAGRILDQSKGLT